VWEIKEAVGRLEVSSQRGGSLEHWTGGGFFEVLVGEG